MNRTVLIARILAVLILVVFAILMMNLYARLQSMQSERPAAAAKREP